MRDNEMDRLVPLDQMDDFKVADGDPDVRGWDVVASDGQKVGHVEDLLVDPGAMKVRYQGPVTAPIAKGQHIADLVVAMPDGEQVMPLVAGEAVGQAGFFGRAWIGLKQLFGMA